MSLMRSILCVLFPPASVIDKGCGPILIVFLLTMCAWVPGVLAAVFINTRTVENDF